MASAAMKGLSGKRFWNVAAMPHAAPYRRPDDEYRTRRTRRDVGRRHPAPLHRLGPAATRPATKARRSPFAFDVREHVLAGEGHFANVQVPENVNPLLASARGIPKTLSRTGKRPYSARSGACSDVLRRAAEWLSATRTAIAECVCERGCPSCVYSPKCGNGNQPLDKAGAVRLLDALLIGLRPDGRA